MGSSGRRGATGLEWLLEETAKPDPSREPAPRPDPIEAALAALQPMDDIPERWSVVPLQPIPADEVAAAIDPPVLPSGVLPSRESMRNNSLDATLLPASREGGKTETRASSRAAVDFEVRFRKGSEAVVAPGRDVSKGGLFVETTRFLPEGEVFQVQLIFAPPHPRQMSVIAEVVWVTSGDPEASRPSPPGMGVKFLDVDDKDVPFLSQLATST